MNGAQLLMAHSDSSGLMNGLTATQSFVDGQMRATRHNKSESAQITDPISMIREVGWFCSEGSRNQAYRVFMGNLDALCVR
jgi:hypothetical protein